MTQQLTVPEIEVLGDNYTLRWSEGVIIELKELYLHRDKNIDAEIEVMDEQELDPHLYGPVRSSITKTFRTAITEIEKVSERTDWSQRFTQVKKLVLAKYRAGVPVIALGNIDPPSQTEEVLTGVVWEELPTLIYGPGGIGKSIIALNLMSAIHTGASVAGLHTMQSNCLYLDWETSEKMMWWRNNEILAAKGQEIGSWPDPDYPDGERTGMVYYRYMSGPLVNDVEYLKKEIATLGIGTICIDSAGPACGGEPESAEATLKFFKALREIGSHDKPLQSIILAHITHEGKRSGRSNPFGSVYWINIPRNVFELQSDQVRNSNHSDFALHHKKSNTGSLRKATGFRLTWDVGCTIEYLDIRKNARLVGGLPMGDQAQMYIAKKGPQTIDELAALINPTTTRSLSSTLSGDERFVSKNGKWDYRETLGVEEIEPVKDG